MAFQPIVPLQGFSGWAFLKRTMDDQKEAFNKSSLMEREVAAFKAKMENVSTAEDVVGDYELLKVALGAFGLDDDIKNKFFIQKVIEDGTADSTALANRLADPRYKRLSEAFGQGLGDLGSSQGEDFVAKIVSSYRELRFETEVGKQDEDMRLVLNLKREISLLAAEDRTSDSKWFGVMGLPPVRKVFEVALGLPNTFSGLDIDLQLDTFKERSEVMLGISEISDFSEASHLERLVENFFARRSVSNNSYLSRGSIALTLLSQ